MSGFNDAGVHVSRLAHAINFRERPDGPLNIDLS